MNVNVNGKPTEGTHDSGANFTGINETLTKPFKINVLPCKSVYKSSSGLGVCKGRANVKMKIGSIENNMDVSILDKNLTNHNILLWLDAHEKFKLTLNEKLKIHQQKTKEFRHTKDSTTNNIELTAQTSQVQNGKEHIKNSFDLEYLHETEKSLMIQMLKKNFECFVNSKYDIGCTTIDKCRIPLINENLITTQGAYRTDIVQQKRLTKSSKISKRTNLSKQVINRS